MEAIGDEREGEAMKKCPKCGSEKLYPMMVDEDSMDTIEFEPFQCLKCGHIVKRYFECGHEEKVN